MKSVLGAILVLFVIGNNRAVAQEDMASARKTMVRIQLQDRGISSEATLKAMEKVPRHLFVPHKLKKLAYRDGPLAIGHGQTISQPYIVAFMTQALDLKSTDKVLEIGTGSGYQAAVLGEIVQQVYTIEIVKALADRAKTTLDSLQYKNIEVRSGDGYHGWPEQMPFDAIMVTAGAADIPKPLIDQLKEGGRMVIPVGPPEGVSELVKITKKKGKLIRENLLPVRFVPFTRERP